MAQFNIFDFSGGPTAPTQAIKSPELPNFAQKTQTKFNTGLSKQAPGKKENFMGYEINTLPSGQATFVSKQDGRIRTFKSAQEAKNLIQGEATRRATPAPAQVPKNIFQSPELPAFAQEKKTQFMEGLNQPTQETQPPKQNTFSNWITPEVKASQTSPINMFKDEQKAFAKMKEDGLGDEQAIQLIKQRRKDLMGGKTGLSIIESAALLKMQQDGLSTTNALKMLKQYRLDAKQPFFKDKYKEEGIFEQGIKAIPRAVSNIGEQIKGDFRDLGLGASSLILRSVNELNRLTGSPEYSPELAKNIQETTGSTGFMGDISKSARASTGLMADYYAPGAIAGFQTAGELPGTQYIVEGISKATDIASKKIAEQTGADENVVKDIVGTAFNTMMVKGGIGTKGTTPDILKKAKEARTAEISKQVGAGKASDITTGLGKFGKTAVTELGKTGLGTIKDIAKQPIDIAKAPFTLAKSIYGNKIKREGLGEGIGVTEAGTKFEVEKPGFIQNLRDNIFGSKDKTEIATNAVFPKIVKTKGPEALVKSGETSVNGLTRLYEDKAKGNIEADIYNMKGGAEGIQEGLDYHGSKIGELTDNKATVKTNDLISNLENSVKTSPLKSVNSKLFGLAKDIITDIKDLGENPTISQIQDGLSGIKNIIYNNPEIIKGLSKTEIGKGINDFMRLLEERFNKTIEESSGKTAELKEHKKAYSDYMKIRDDFVKSLQVELRNQMKSGGGLSGNVGKMAGAYELLSNPSISGIIKAITLKTIGEELSISKSRSGNYAKFMRLLDKEAIQRGLQSNLPKNDTINSVPSPNTDISKLQKLKSPLNKSETTKTSLKDLTTNTKGFISPKAIGQDLGLIKKPAERKRNQKNNY